MDAQQQMLQQQQQQQQQYQQQMMQQQQQQAQAFDQQQFQQQQQQQYVFQGPLESAAHADSLLATSLAQLVHGSPDFEINNFPSQSALSDKKTNLMERLGRETAVVQNFRNANHESLAVIEQWKHDITQYRENLAFQEKQQIILRRERDMLEHRFKWTRSDFNIALTTSTLLREKIQEIVDGYQQEIALQSGATGEMLSKLDDTQFFYTLIAQIQTKQDDLVRFNALLKNDIALLQTLLQSILTMTFDDHGLPRSSVADVFQTLPEDEYAQLIRIAKDRIANQQNKDTNTTGDSSTTSISMHDSGSTALNTGVISDPTGTNSSITHDSTTSLVGEQLRTHSLLPLGLALPNEKPVHFDSNNDLDANETALASIANQSHVIDSFLQKCVSMTGHFQPRVFIEHLRRQSDQLLLLQRSHTLLTSQLFQLQQDKALLLAYFESFLKETASLKQLLHASNVKVDEDSRTIFALQQRNIALEQEVEFFQTDRILTLASSQLESVHQNSLVENAHAMIGQVEKAHGSIALAHTSIHKLRTVNAQQTEQIESLEAKLDKAEQEKANLVKIIAHLEANQKK